MRSLLKKIICCLLLLVMFQAYSVNATEQACTVTDRSDSVVLLLCSENLEDKALVEAGKASCALGQQCNVWIWDNKANMPLAAPETDAELPKKNAAAAVAVWINDSQSLMRLKKVR